MKLLRQQQELARLRSAIEAAKAGVDPTGAAPAAAQQLDDIDEGEEDYNDEELQAMLAQLNSKRNELNDLLKQKEQLQQLIEAQTEPEQPPSKPSPPPATKPPPPRPQTAPPAGQREINQEVRSPSASPPDSLPAGRALPSVPIRRSLRSTHPVHSQPSPRLSI